MSNTPREPDNFDYLEQDPAGDQDSATYIAPDEPMGAHAYGTTSAEERAGETFEHRTKHTNPEVFGRPEFSKDGLVGQIWQPGDEDVDDVDDETNVVALDGEMLSYDDMTAEEAAMHTTNEP